MKIDCHKRVAKKGVKAFTIAEVVVAVAIIAIGAAGLMGSFNYAFFVIELARENERATQIMTEKAEAIRCYNWDHVSDLNQTFIAPYDPSGSTNSTGINYSGMIAITAFPYAASYSTNMRTATISLQWITRGRVNHSRTLTTFIAKDGIQNYVY